jgi:ATP-dependent Clp protease ATP-binding subunit ClpX
MLTVPKNALLRQYQKLFAYENVKLDFTPQALSSIARKAIERDTGARRTPRILEQVLRKPMLEIPSLSGIRHCVVGDFIIDGKAGAN